MAGAGLLAQGGARYAGGQPFLPEALTTGLAPAVLLSVLGGYVLGALQTLQGQGAEEWMYVCGCVYARGMWRG